jgi:hypothetical protein
MSFNFLWKGNNISSHVHLCSWEVLSQSKSSGGWGLRNLSHFNLALISNTLWHILFQEGIWHKIVMEKYLKKLNVINWVRSTNFQQRPVSRI